MAFSFRSGRRIAVASATVLALSGCANTPAADAQDTVSSRVETAIKVPEVDTFIAEASQRYRIPEHWIRAVMRAESAGNPRAVSSAGAMGLMQIMPGTWAELRDAHGLGADPFDRRDNILAGTAYLRLMYDRFGAPSFLAAYNAGPGRYAEHLRTGRPLPRETRAYVAALSRTLDFTDAASVQPARRDVATTWRSAPLFASVSSAPDAQQNAQSRQGNRSAERDVHTERTEPSNPLFVSKSEESDR